jgi:arylsulfatase A-like enzyme
LNEFATTLKVMGIWDECLFVVLGDNGEAFYEHGFGNHSGPMNDEAVRTLVAIKPPFSMGLKNRRVDYPVSHIDIAATIPAMAGLPLPQSFQGIPLHPDPAPLYRPVFMYANAFVRQYAVVQNHFKLLITEHPMQRTELYDLQQDPGETSDVAAQHPLQTANMLAQLLDWRATQTQYYQQRWFETRSPPRRFSN